MTESVTLARPFEATTPRTLSASSLIFWILLGLGVALRVLLLFSNALVLDSDRGVVYLMALRVRDGEFPLVYWGQAYGGSLLPLTAGLVMLVAGPHLEVLAVVSVLFFAGATVLVRAIARAAIGPAAGDVAGIAFFFPGALLLLLSLADPGFYGPSLLFALGALYVAGRPLPTTHRWVSWLLVGVFAGIALWQSPMGGALALPALIVLLIRDRSVLRAVVGLAGVAVGVSPWLVQLFLVKSDAAPLSDRTIFYPQSLVSFFSELLTWAFAAGTLSIERWAVTLVCAALFVLFAVVTVRQRSLVLAALGFGTGLCYLVVIAGAGNPLHGDSYRYAVFVVPALAVALAWMLTRVRVIGLIALFLFPTLTITQVLVQSPQLSIGEVHRFGAGMPVLEQALDEMDAHAVFASYWIAYSLSADTGGRIEADALSVSRDPDYRAAALAAEPTVLVVTADGPNDQFLSSDASIPPYSRTTVREYAIYRFDGGFNPTAQAWFVF